MKHFTLAIVLLAVFASVVLADRPSFKKKPVDPVPEAAVEEVEKPLPKKPMKPSLKQKPEAPKELPEAEVEEEEKPLPKKPLLPSINKKPQPEEDEVSVLEEVLEESSVELSEEAVEEAPAKKPLLALKPKPLAADLKIQPPEHVVDSEEPLELEPPTVAARPKPALVNVKA